MVIAPSASLTGGPVVEWARAVLPDPDSAVLIPGHTDEESPSGLLERLRGSDRRFTLHGLDGPEEVTVRAQVADVRLSAHADRAGLLEIVREVGAARVHLVHGIPFHQKEFGRILTAEHRRWSLGREGVPVELWPPLPGDLDLFGVSTASETPKRPRSPGEQAPGPGLRQVRRGDGRKAG